MSYFLHQIQSAIEYVKSRQNEDGGFCFYRYEDWGISESNIPDTFYAIAVFSFVDHPVPNKESVVSFLRSHGPSDGMFPSITIGWCFLNAMQKLGEPLAVSPLEWLQLMFVGMENALSQRRQIEWSGMLRDMARLLELAQVHGSPCPKNIHKLLREAIFGLKWPFGGYGWPGASLLDTCEVVRIHKLMQWELPHGALEYTRRCESDRFGFTLTPDGSNATLSVQEAGCDIKNQFNERPLYALTLLHYLLTCQTGKGGFARVPGALADLENTYLAFKTLKSLGYI